MDTMICIFMASPLMRMIRQSYRFAARTYFHQCVVADRTARMIYPCHPEARARKREPRHLEGLRAVRANITSTRGRPMAADTLPMISDRQGSNRIRVY